MREKKRGRMRERKNQGDRKEEEKERRSMREKGRGHKREQEREITKREIELRERGEREKCRRESAWGGAGPGGRPVASRRGDWRWYSRQRREDGEGIRGCMV